MTTPTPAMRRLAAVAGPVALSTLGVFLSLFAAVAVDAQPRASERVAAVFPPWWDAARIIGAAARPAPAAPPPAPASWDVFAQARFSAVLAFAPSDTSWRILE